MAMTCCHIFSSGMAPGLSASQEQARHCQLRLIAAYAAAVSLSGVRTHGRPAHRTLPPQASSAQQFRSDAGSHPGLQAVACARNGHWFCGTVLRSDNKARNNGSACGASNWVVFERHHHWRVSPVGPSSVPAMMLTYFPWSGRQNRLAPQVAQKPRCASGDDRNHRRPSSSDSVRCPGLQAVALRNGHWFCGTVRSDNKRRHAAVRPLRI